MISVLHIGGNVATSGGIDSDIWASTPGSLIAVIGHTFDTQTPPITPAFSDCTDNKLNTYTLAPNAALYSGTNLPGIAVFYNIGGTRGANHQVHYQTASGTATQFDNVAVIEFASDSGAITFDPTTAHVLHSTSNLLVIPAGPIVGSQIAIYATTVDSGGSAAWTPPSEYTNIINQGNGATTLVTDAAYKIGETGTPTLGGTWPAGVGTANTVVVSFAEPAPASSQVLVPPNWPRVT